MNKRIFYFQYDFLIDSFYDTIMVQIKEVRGVMMHSKRATIYDIAALANTSAATVSRVLSNKDYYVSTELQERVLLVAKELGYTPNLLGRNLKSNKSTDIGVIVPTITNPYYTMLVQGVEETAAKNHYDLFLCNVNQNAQKEKKFIDSLIQKQVAGIILASISGDHSFLEQYQHPGFHMVSMDQSIPMPSDQVIFDFYQGGYLAGRHLVELGHRHIAFISAPIQARYSRREILKGFKAALAQDHISLSPPCIIESTDAIETNTEVYEYKIGSYFVEKILQCSPRPTAIFCINDITALSVLHHLQHAGIKVPLEISLMGFDNIPLSQISYPSLTTIDQSAYEMGALACLRLIDKIENPKLPPVDIALKPTLIVRSSTGGPLC